MHQCIWNRTGFRCRNEAADDSNYCGYHIVKHGMPASDRATTNMLNSNRLLLVIAVSGWSMAVILSIALMLVNN